jgi:hypothetical protein
MTDLSRTGTSSFRQPPASLPPSPGRDNMVAKDSLWSSSPDGTSGEDRADVASGFPLVLSTLPKLGKGGRSDGAINECGCVMVSGDVMHSSPSSSTTGFSSTSNEALVALVALVALTLTSLPSLSFSGVTTRAAAVAEEEAPPGKSLRTTQTVFRCCGCSSSLAAAVLLGIPFSGP